jgi:hypothetical protein
LGESLEKSGLSFSALKVRPLCNRLEPAPITAAVSMQISRAGAAVIRP